MATDIDIIINAKNNANAELLKLSKELASVSRALKDVAGPADQAARGTKKAGDAAEDAGKKADSASTKFAKLGVEMLKGAAMGVGFAAVNAAMRGVGQAFDFVVDAGVNMNAQLEQSRIAFTTMLGSAEDAEQFLQDLADFAKRTPFDFPGLVTASQRMMAYGFSAEQTLPLLEDIGNVAAAFGSGAEGINRISLALGQMAAKGRVQSQEMLQLTESNIRAWDILAEHVGVSVSQIQEDVTAGKISADVMIEAFQEFSQANFGDMMAAQSRTFTGAMSNIQDVLTMASADALVPFYDLLRDGAIELADFLESADFAEFVEGTVAAMETAGGGIRDFVEVAGPGFVEVAKSIRDFLNAISEFDQRMAAISGEDGHMSLFQHWVVGVRMEMDLLAAALRSGGGYVMMYGGYLHLANIELELMINLAKAAKDLDFSAGTQAIRNAEQQRRAVGEMILQGADMVVDGWSDAYDTMNTKAEWHTSQTAGFFDQMSAEIVEASKKAAAGFDAGMAELGDYGPFLEEVLIGPILKLAPQAREHLKELFTLDPSLAGEWADQVAVAMRVGAISFEEGLDLMAELPAEVITPALEGVRKDIIRELGEEAWSGVINEPLQRELALVDAALKATGNEAITAGGELVEFATMGERALRDVEAAAMSLADVQVHVHTGVTTAADAMSHWEDELKNIEDALEPLQKKIENGIELSAEEADLYDTLTWGAERYAGGLENDLMPAFQEAVARSVEFTKRQDELNQMLADGKITQEEHKDMMLDAALAGDDASLAAHGLANAQGDVIKAIDEVIGKIRDLLYELGLIPSSKTVNVNIVTTGGTSLGTGFTAYADGGPVKETGIALVGEKGPELVVLNKGSEVIPNHMLPFIGGYADGTIDDVGKTALSILGNLEVSLDPTSVAEAQADLAALWDSRRIAEELGLGEAVIAEIDEKIQAKQSELDLIGQVAGTAIGQGVISGLESQRIADLVSGTFESILGNLDAFASGDLAASIEKNIAELFSLSDIARQMGEEDLANAYLEQAWAAQEEWKRVMIAMGTDAGKALVDGLAVESEWDKRMADLIAGPRAAENVQSAIDDLNSKLDMAAILGAPQEMIAQWESERDALTEEATTYWSDIAQAAAAGLVDQATLEKYAEAGGEMLQAAVDGLMGEGALEEMLGAGKLTGEDAFSKLAAALSQTVVDSQGNLVAAAELYGTGFVDDIVKGVFDGMFDVEQAYKLLAQIPVDQLAPALQQLESQWTQGLMKAITDGNGELQAEFLMLLETLGLVEAQFGNIAQAASADIKSKQNTNVTYAPPPMSRMATGGLVTSPLVALVGEAGPEMVQPLSAGHPERQRLIDDVAAAVARQLGGGDRANFTVLLDSKPMAYQVGQTMHQGHKVKAGP